MKLSTKCRYGARAIIEIARSSKDKPVKRKTIVDNQQIPDSYLKNILISLKDAGLIKATRGSKGGYVLSRSSSEITFLEVIQALEGSLTLVDCVNEPGVCDRVDSCTTRDVWRKMTEAQEGVLSNITVKELVEKEGKSKNVNYSI
ncbi:RrF2 family transcriptional regulator [Spirochaetota bacterium]